VVKKIFFAIFAEFLNVLTRECDKHYITSCTVETMIIYYCWILLHRDDADGLFEDVFGLPIFIYDKDPLMVSIGKVSP
jgi:hypothetical protein